MPVPTPISDFKQLAQACGFTLTVQGELIAPEKSQDLSVMLESLYIRAFQAGALQASESAARSAIAAELEQLEKALSGQLNPAQAEALARFKQDWLKTAQPT